MQLDVAKVQYNLYIGIVIGFFFIITGTAILCFFKNVISILTTVGKFLRLLYTAQMVFSKNHVLCVTIQFNRAILNFLRSSCISVTSTSGYDLTVICVVQKQLCHYYNLHTYTLYDKAVL